VKNLINQRLPRNLESVTSYRGDSRVIEGWRGRQQRLATVREQRLWHCKTCDEYFQTLGEAREHKHG
jgi:hypothetical protein